MPVKIDNCPLCGHHESKPYYDLVYPCKEAHNVVCTGCGLVYLNPRPDFAELSEYYAEYSNNTQPNVVTVPQWFAEFCRSIARQRLEYLDPYLKDGDRVLDIGCSFGAMLNVLANETGKSLEVVGVNPEPGYAQAGRDMYGVDIRVGMFEDQDFAPASFDVIILDNVIEHFIDPVKSVREIHALLAEGGRFYIVTNDLDRPHGFLWQNLLADHTITFSPRTLAALLEAEGFVVENMNEDGHVTLEGYHYPYIQCVARKSERPQSYDFFANGDAADGRINAAQAYIKSFLATDNFAKRLYEERLKNQGQGSPFMELRAKLMLKLGMNTNYTPIGHTLPSEEYVYRRVCVCACDTIEDVELVKKLVPMDDLNPLLFIISRHTSDADFVVVSQPSFLGKGNMPKSVRTPEVFVRWAASAYGHVNELVYIHSSHAIWSDDLDFMASYRAYKEAGLAVMVHQPKEVHSAPVPFAPPAILKWIVVDEELLSEVITIRLEEAMQEYGGVNSPEVRRRISKRKKHRQGIVERRGEDNVPWGVGPL